MLDRETTTPRSASLQRRPKRRYFTRRKVCHFCADHKDPSEYKDAESLKRFLSDRYKILASRKSGVCPKHQRALSKSIKHARHLAILPFSPDHRTN